jgi:hypothetical protein
MLSVAQTIKINSCRLMSLSLSLSLSLCLSQSISLYLSYSLCIVDLWVFALVCHQR